MWPLALLITASFAQRVTLPNGDTLQGGQCSEYGYTNNAMYFTSVPYAQPPTGDLRFAAPQPYDGAYGGSHTTLTPNCPQFGQEFIEMTAPSSEDCLYLDIWMPPNAKNLPVKFWIYGGGNTAGSVSNPTYNGCNLATDSVVVSVNYRLGPLGFLALQSGGVEGNMGIQDQLLALQWVQDNIEAFGGDPSKVLLFGESAGASDTYVISTLPQAPSLIQAGISESGGGRPFPGAAAANAFGEQWAMSLNCSDATCLRALSLEQLNTTLPENTVPSYNPYSVHSFGAFVDGNVVPAQPADVGVQVPFIYGANSMEYTLLILSQPGVTSPELITPEAYAAYLKSSFGAAAPLVAQQYPVAAFNSTPFPAFYALVQVATESNFWCPAYQGLRKAAEKGIPTWTYRWAQAPNCPWYTSIPPAVIPDIFGASHTAEIPFVFNDIESHPLVFPNCQFSANEISLSHQMVEFWTNMAAYGAPSGGWPGFTVDSSLGINIENGSAQVTPGPVDYSVCSFWDHVRDVVVQSSNSTVVSGGYAPSGSASAGASASMSMSSGVMPSASVQPATGGASSSMATAFVWVILTVVCTLAVPFIHV